MPAATLPPPRRRARLRPVARSAATGFSRALPWLLASLTLTILTLAGKVPSWAPPIFVACTGWRYLIERRGWPLPSMLTRALLFLPVGWLVMQNYAARPGAEGLLTLLIALISLKTLELRSARDFTVGALLGYFLVLSAFFYSQSFALTLYLGVLLGANTVALILCHGGAGGRAWPAVKLALGMSLQALPLVALLFVVFPRISGRFFQRVSGGGVGRTGMSDRLQPGAFSALAQSSEKAFRATITKSDGPLTQAELYWRGLVLDECSEALSWRANAARQQMTPPDPPKDRPVPGEVDQKVTLSAQGEHWLFALDRPAAVLSAPGLHPEISAAETLRNRDAINTGTVVYTVASRTGSSPPEEMTAWDRKYYTRLPPDLSPRVRELARSWRGRGGTDSDVVRAASQFFGKGGFAYTLNPGLLPPGGRGLDTFLFQTRQGFCEHYAAAFSVLMRAAGVPARIVVGYQGGEFNRWGAGHYLVLQSDAHAWSEVWLAGRGWQREDPTAFVAPDRVSYGAENYAALGGESLSEQARLDRLGGPAGWRWLVHSGLLAWDALDEQWNLAILAYDEETRLNVFESLGVGSLSWVNGIALTLAAAFSLLGAGTLGMRWLGQGKPPADDPARRLYARFRRHAAARAGLRPDPAEGPLDFARRAAAVFPAQAAQIGRLTALYVATRYAPPGPAADRRAEWQALRTAVQQLRLPRVRR